MASTSRPPSARLKPGVTLAQAQADTATLFAASKADEPRLFSSDTHPVDPASPAAPRRQRASALICIGGRRLLPAANCLCKRRQPSAGPLVGARTRTCGQGCDRCAAGTPHPSTADRNGIINGNWMRLGNRYRACSRCAGSYTSRHRKYRERMKSRWMGACSQSLCWSPC